MADQNCSSPSPTPIIITTSAEHVKSDVDHPNPVSSSCTSRIFSEKKFPPSEDVSYISQIHQSNSTLVFSDPAISSSSENSNGVPEVYDKSPVLKASSFLRPSALSGGFNSSSPKSFSDLNRGDLSFGTKCPLKSPRLNLTSSKFGSTDGSSSKSPFLQSKNPFTSSVNFDDKPLLSSSDQQTETDSSGNKVTPKTTSPVLGAFTSSASSNSLGSIATNSAISVPNFVFGQNLHERVTDGVKFTNENDSKPSEATTSNGTSDMLFTSVLTSTEAAGKENLNNDISSGSKESSSLLEDAARYQEARANKRKYEEVLVTTGEEGEENILQVNVKLFAFDNGTWVERGRGTLRLNDKNCDEATTSRIVIRTLGSLRVVLNTKIWSGMSLNRASERSVRLTALDPNGQLKIFLIQASPKDMGTLYRFLEARVKRCQERDPENQEIPEKKLALEDNKT